MKIVEIHVHCTVCGFSTKYDINTNEHGFFSIPEAYCPNDLMILTNEVKKLPSDIEGGD